MTSGGVWGMISDYMNKASNAYIRGDGEDACANLNAAATLVNTKIPNTPYTPFDPRFSPGSNRILLRHYQKHLGLVTIAIRKWLDAQAKDGITVETADKDD